LPNSPEHVAGGKVATAQPLMEKFGLRALSDARRPKKNEPPGTDDLRLR